MLKFTRFGVRSLFAQAPSRAPMFIKLRHQPLAMQAMSFSTRKPDPSKEDLQQKKQSQPQQPNDKANTSLNTPHKSQKPGDPILQPVELSQEQTEHIKKIDELDKKHAFRTALMAARLNINSEDLNRQLVTFKKSVKMERSASQYRDAILFQDVLKNQVRILLYDTKGDHVRKQYRFIFFTLLLISGVWFGLHQLIKQPKIRIYVTNTPSGRFFYYSTALCILSLIPIALSRYRRLYKYHVEKIVYDTQTQKFQLSQRKPWGSRYNTIVDKNSLVYTQSPLLWKRGINYFDIQLKRMYEIAEPNAWIKQDLFSHLISQRINTSI